MTKVCRLCLMKLQRGSKYFNINAVESFTGFMPYRDQLTTCIPEMAIDLIPNPVICNNCRTALKSAYDFKTRCLFVEKKIQSYIEGQQDNDGQEINYDLSQIPSDDVPRMNKIALLLPKSDASEPDEIISPEKFLNLQNEEIISIQNFGTKMESEDSNSSFSPSLIKDDSGTSSTIKRFSITKGSRGTYPRIRNHVSRLYSQEEFVCNFCAEHFKSLQQLRKHNNNCSKSVQKETTKTILTKRPHLPTKAKNHLKKWLFQHTDHPYPTDQEKQQLMKETNLSLLQVENWFINARRRILQDLTKLKSKGFQSDDLNDTHLGLEMDFEEYVKSVGMRKPKKITLDFMDESQEEENEDVTQEEDPLGKIPDMDPLEGPPAHSVKQEPVDFEVEPVDLNKVKSEVEDNR